MSEIGKTLKERGNDNGNYRQMCATIRCLKKVVESSYNHSSGHLTDDQEESIYMICHKLGRLLTGNPNKFDHWHDIEGYANLISSRLKPSCSTPTPNEVEGDE